MVDLAVRILKYGLLDFVGDVAYQFDSVSKRYNEHLSSLVLSVRKVSYRHFGIRCIYTPNIGFSGIKKVSHHCCLPLLAFSASYNKSLVPKENQNR